MEGGRWRVEGGGWRVEGGLKQSECQWHEELAPCRGSQSVG